MNQLNLQQAYSRQNWQNWLSDIFGSQVQFEAQAETIDIDRDNIKSIQRFASVKLADGKTLAVLDIETLVGIQIARNRVGLRNLVEKLIDHVRYHGILAFYHSDTLVECRMSFISSEPKIDENGNFVIEHTTPKRYTYVLGENEKTKTPADRLKIIATKNGKATLEDVKNAFSVETLTKEFYKELSDWYFWALQNVEFPNDLQQDKEINNSTSVIRLITRLMFVWFLKQKELISDELFDTQELEKMLNYNDKTGSTFYKAILQNLFFATLNTEMGEKRKFVNRQSGVQGFYRYERFFKNKERFIELTKEKTPFLNGGLFENLDKNVGEENEIRIDCFSNRIDKEKLLKVPDFLFFGEEKQIDLNKIYDTKGKTYKVRGLIDILKTYNFTIEENTPTDIEVALDPELLGKVFENLLASFNPETQITARKQTGSFYTPREIVDYMVNESLNAYLQEKVGDNWENDVRTISALNNIKILDPACGSGAFPMGILQKMVQILQKLDPQNELWKQRQLDIAGKIEDEQAREAAIENIEEAFENNKLDYGRKLFLVENCIFGIDIQSIAVQISKLRFFISLICEQTTNPEKPNLGIRPLPNLETKFVAANTLIGLEKPIQKIIGMDIVEPLEKELAEVRHKHFSARTPETKRKYREKDGELRQQIAEKLKEIGYANDTAEKIAQWNPYDQNTHAEWFDAEWMFGLTDGFDILLGNPPYKILTKNNSQELATYNQLYKSFEKSNSKNIFVLFIEKGLQLLSSKARLTYIVPEGLFKTRSYDGCVRIMKKSGFIDYYTTFSTFVFDNAVTGNLIFMFNNCQKCETKRFHFNKNFQISEVYEKTNTICEKIEFNTVSLKNISTTFKGMVIKDRNTVISSKLGSHKNVFLFGKNISKWFINSKYFTDYEVLEIVGGTKKLEKHQHAPRILIRRTGDTLCCAFLNEPALTESTLYSCWSVSVNVDNRYLIALLNSKLLNYYNKEKNITNQQAFPQILMTDLENLPIKKSENQQPIILLVNKIIFLKNTQNTPVSNIVNNEIIAIHFEKVLDACVYELYFEEEIKSAQVDVLELISKSLDKVSSLPIEQQILRLFEEWNDYKNEVRNRVILQETRSESVAQIIKSMHQ